MIFFCEYQIESGIFQRFDGFIDLFRKVCLYTKCILIVLYLKRMGFLGNSLLAEAIAWTGFTVMVIVNIAKNDCKNVGGIQKNIIQKQLEGLNVLK